MIPTTFRRAAIAVATLAIGCGAAFVPAPARATTTPPWEPDSSSVGGLVFYNSAGDVITGGSITDAPIAAYVEGTSTIFAGDTKATLYGYLPVKGEVPGQWQGEGLSASTTYPNSAAPSPVSTSTLPVVTGKSGDLSVEDLEEDYPNTDTSTTDGYAGIYQLRLKTTAAGTQAPVTYDSADIQITGSTWSVVYTASPTVSTTTVLTATPASSAKAGASVSLTATVSPSTATGSIEFKDGTTTLQTVPLTSGSASYSTSALAAGSHSLSAVYVPSGSGFTGSTSSTLTYTISKVATKVSLKASASNIKKGKKLTLTATESPATSGTVTFYDGSKKLGSVAVKSGKATLSTTKLSIATHTITAKFAPSKSADYSASTSKAVKVKVTK